MSAHKECHCKCGHASRSHKQKMNYEKSDFSKGIIKFKIKCVAKGCNCEKWETQPKIIYKFD